MSAADHNLLYGALALQLEFIDRDGFAQALEAWATDRDRSLGEILLAQGRLDAQRHDLLQRLVAERLRDADAGRALASLPAVRTIKEDVARCGDPAMTLALDTLAPSADAAAIDFEASLHSGKRFRVLRPHATGGLGQVMLAHDGELHREVALKEIQAHYADDPDSRARFVLEGEITGRLEHPGVVPVYALGKFPDGRPYYVMRFIHGESLEDAVAKFHASQFGVNQRDLALRALLRRFIDVCNTMAYAHARGVLHRDLKPANVMLGEYGETLVVDWGLARTMDRPENLPRPAVGTLHPMLASDSSRTRVGTIMGTPAYASPEQLEGRLDELGPASDVYSLGATLYHLLAGKPPLEGDTLEVLARGRRGEFVPPRRANPHVPARLEAVVLRAMAHRPADRYASAAELAEEIEHWLADLPVKAYREPLSMQARRWARRHRTTVTTAAALLVTTTLALAVFVVLLSGKQRETELRRREADRERERAGQLAQRAEQQRALAMATLRDVVEDQRLAGGGAEARQRDRARLLDGAIERLEQLRGPHEAEEVLARAYLKRGDLALTQKNPVLAAEKFERARAVLLALSEAHADEESLRQALWQALTGLGHAALARKQPREALPLFAEAVKVARPMASSTDDLLGGLRRLRESLMHLGLAYQEAGQLMDAAGAYHEAVQTGGRLVQFNAQGGRHDRALSLARLGEVRLKQDETAVAIKTLHEAEETIASVPDAERTGVVLEEWAVILDRLAEAHGKRGETEQAKKAADDAALLRERLKRAKAPIGPR